MYVNIKFASLSFRKGKIRNKKWTYKRLISKLLKSEFFKHRTQSTVITNAS